MHGRISKTVISERDTIRISRRAARHDYEYKRCGKSNIFFLRPLAGKRIVKVTEENIAGLGLLVKKSPLDTNMQKNNIVMDNSTPIARITL